MKPAARTQAASLHLRLESSMLCAGWRAQPRHTHLWLTMFSESKERQNPLQNTFKHLLHSFY